MRLGSSRLPDAHEHGAGSAGAARTRRHSLWIGAYGQLLAGATPPSMHHHILMGLCLFPPHVCITAALACIPVSRQVVTAPYLGKVSETSVYRIIGTVTGRCTAGVLHLSSAP